jgi:hypothetical protein
MCDISQRRQGLQKRGVDGTGNVGGGKGAEDDGAIVKDAGFGFFKEGIAGGCGGSEDVTEGLQIFERRLGLRATERVSMCCRWAVRESLLLNVAQEENVGFIGWRDFGHFGCGVWFNRVRFKVMMCSENAGEMMWGLEKGGVWV